MMQGSLTKIDMLLAGYDSNPAEDGSLDDYFTVIPIEMNKMVKAACEDLDLNGKLVLEYNEGIKSPGKHKIIVNGSELSSGPYFCVFSIGSIKMIKKILLLK